MISEYKFLHTDFFWLLLLIPLVILISRFVDFKPSLKFTFGYPIASHFNAKTLVKRILYILLCTALITALASPYTEEHSQEKHVLGKAMAIVIDVSESMRSLDFKGNRLTFAKKIASEVITGTNKKDKISIVPFGAESYIHSPLSTNKKINTFMLNQLQIGQLEGSSSAVGTGVSQGINALLKDSSKHKSVLVITDGSSLGLGVSTADVIAFAKANKVIVNSIAIGDKGKAPFPIVDQYGTKTIYWMENDIDVSILEQLSEVSNGQFLQVKNENDNYTLEPFLQSVSNPKVIYQLVIRKKIFQRDLIYIALILGCVIVFLTLIQNPLAR